MNVCKRKKRAFIWLSTPLLVSIFLTIHTVFRYQPQSIEIEKSSSVKFDDNSHNVIRETALPSPRIINTFSNKTIVYISNTTFKVNTSACEHWFEPTFVENLKVVSNYPRGNVTEYFLKIGGNLTQPKQMMTKFPVLVTAASSGHFKVSQGLLKSIHEILMPKYGDVKIIYYDMGLLSDQLIALEKYCRCEVRKFPFSDLPKHVSLLKTYTWKPIIVKMLLMEYGWVWYMDSSARFTTNDLDLPLKYSLDNSVLYFTYGNSLSVAQHTDKRTVAYLGEDMCKYRYFGELEAGFVLYHFDHVTSVIVDQWVSCALVQDCMAPAGAKLGCNNKITTDAQCHRYDQAVLSIIIRRLFHEINDYPNVIKPFRIHVIRRGDGVNYFPI
ncbi:uncharacterized protein LOC132730254 isoform X2 [Ruditapes philippinarum]|uniref:uncharacterized protein LOC132730254 isoform X2 n=1 Tax=Ruditapes philippinarum TaxID=129788 RepID=UPI00295C1D70|nr:uncharacterized protein LOC132730254 isoform X2 [Ruditapes philippinarum]